ncbi:penicillin-binding protein 2 [Candidatus Saganbacteria bacterium]|nr:penicillin-binding protein 2 [Candidatus Saganbacteria bacterium]
MKNKSRAVFAVFAAIFVLLFLRLLQLQMIEAGHFNDLALANAAKTVPDPAPRGVIYDRNNKVLVKNWPVFSVRVTPDALRNRTSEARAKIIALLNELLGEKIELKVSAAEPFIIKNNISLSAAIRIEEKKDDLPGVVVTSLPVRLAAHGKLASHLLGYVGEISAADLSRLKSRGYHAGDLLGKDGIEKSYDELIRGVDGGKKVEVDVHGTPLRILESLESVPGPDVWLTIDMELQQAVERALGNLEGAVVVLDVKTGQVMALASSPNYDLNIFTDPKRKSGWRELQYLRQPFINRALAIYPPGSIFKVVTLAAALSEHKVSTEEIFNCRGYYKINNRIAKCWLESGHGPITAQEGLVWSCDAVFYELGRRLGPDLLAKYAALFGLGEKTGIDLPQEKKGMIPMREWKEKYFKEPWYEGDSINYGIGQGWVQVTPLQMAAAYAAIATGKIVKPYVVEQIKDRSGRIVYQAKKENGPPLGIAPEYLNLIREALYNVINRATGIAVRAAAAPAAGKTGTAQTPGLPHAWFICYAPYDDPQISIAAFVAHGAHGDQASAYIARDILKWYRENRLKKTYPPMPKEQYIIHNGRTKTPYRH